MIRGGVDFGGKRLGTAAYRHQANVGGATIGAVTIGTYNTNYFDDDFLVVCAYNSNSTTLPVFTDTSYSNVTSAGTSLNYAHPSTALSVSIFHKFVPNGTVASINITNASRIFTMFYSGIDRTTPLTEVSFVSEAAGAGASTVENGALLFTPQSGLLFPDPSMVVHFQALKGGASTGTLDARLTQRAVRSANVVELRAGDSNTVVSSWAAGAGSQTAASNNAYITTNLRLKVKNI